MKSFLISIRPKWVAKIFNGDKTAEIRRTAPKDWMDYLYGKTKIKPEPRTGYIYCTQGKPYLAYIDGKFYTQSDSTRRGPAGICFNGKVVAKFTLREVEQVMSEAQDTYCGDYDEVFFTKSLSEWELQEKTCVPIDEIRDYMSDGKAYAWHISDLVIFDEPKELSDFGPEDKVYYSKGSSEVVIEMKRLNHAPQSWQYVEVQR